MISQTSSSSSAAGKQQQRVFRLGNDIEIIVSVSSSFTKDDDDDDSDFEQKSTAAAASPVDTVVSYYEDAVKDRCFLYLNNFSGSLQVQRTTTVSDENNIDKSGKSAKLAAETRVVGSALTRPPPPPAADREGAFEVGLRQGKPIVMAHGAEETGTHSPNIDLVEESDDANIQSHEELKDASALGETPAKDHQREANMIRSLAFLGSFREDPQSSSSFSTDTEQPSNHETTPSSIDNDNSPKQKTKGRRTLLGSLTPVMSNEEEEEDEEAKTEDVSTLSQRQTESSMSNGDESDGRSQISPTENGHHTSEKNPPKLSRALIKSFLNKKNQNDDNHLGDVDLETSLTGESGDDRLTPLPGEAASKMFATDENNADKKPTSSLASLNTSDSSTRPGITKGSATSVRPSLSRQKAAEWGTLLQVIDIKRHMPGNVQRRRLEGRTPAPPTPGVPKIKGLFSRNPTKLYPTKLHELCSQDYGRDADDFLEELQTTLKAEPMSVHVKDSQGRLPLHILGDNAELVGTPQGKKVASTFCFDLFKAYPDAALELDNRGFMPFVTLIDDWLFFLYKRHQEMAANDDHHHHHHHNNPISPIIGSVPAAVLPFARSITSGSNNKDAASKRSTTSSVSSVASSASSTGNNKNTAVTTVDFSDEARDKLSHKSLRAFPLVELWYEVEWCFAMLSMIMDEFGGKTLVFHRPNDNQQMMPLDSLTDGRQVNHRTKLANHLVTALPNLLKTVLLLDSDGGNDRSRLLAMSIFRRILLCPSHVGRWITVMLHRKGTPSKTVVEYFLLVSNTTLEDYTGGFRTTFKEDEDGFQQAQAEVFAAVNRLQGTVASLVVLDPYETKKAASTRVIWDVMNNKLGRPFTLALVLMDLVLHFTLMIAFRNGVRLPGNSAHLAVVPTQVVIVISCHYFIRKACEALVLSTISFSVFRRYFTNIWTLFDIIAIIMTLTAVIWNENHPGEYRNGANACITGLLWMKVVGFLKVVNKELSTFILALKQILFDIRHFMFVLIVTIFMFGDMFHIAVSTKDNGDFCLLEDWEGPTEDFCGPNIAESYLRVYSMLIGDFELNDLKDSTGITTLFVIFTLIGVIIMLNVLIAVVSASYEKASTASALLFGPARVTFVAQNEALESFLTPGRADAYWDHFMSGRKKYVRVLFKLFRWAVLLAILGTAGYALSYLISRSIGLVTQPDGFMLAAGFSVVISFVLFFALSVLLNDAFDRMVRPILPRKMQQCYVRFNNASMRFVSLASSHLFGLYREDTRADVGGEDEEEDDLADRMRNMKAEFEKMLESTRDNLSREIRTLAKLRERDLIQSPSTKVDI